jgi:cytidine deaminase
MKTTSKTLFDNTANSRLMEVQSAIFDGRMFIASNYSRGDDGGALSAVMPASYAHGGKTYTKGSSSLVQIAGTLHAEQAILKELAKVIKNPNKVNPSHVTVIGTKRPCTVCRRVLLAFDKALLKHYPAVHLHFVDQSGATTEVEALDISGLADGSDQTFDAFVATYATQLQKYQGIGQLPGEDVSNSDRTAATAELGDIL